MTVVVRACMAKAKTRREEERPNGNPSHCRLNGSPLEERDDNLSCVVWLRDADPHILGRSLSYKALQIKSSLARVKMNRDKQNTTR